MARIAVDSIDTLRPRTFARVALTLIHVLGAVEACEAIWAVADELSSTQLAGAVGARCQYAGIIKIVTVFTHVVHWMLGAQAHIFIQIVKTRSAIVAGRW